MELSTSLTGDDLFFFLVALILVCIAWDIYFNW
jgi:hypothetical protein